MKYINDLIIKDADTTILVPAQDILLTQVKLPKLSSRKLRQALPYALEETLLEDISQLHFAIGHRQPDGALPVAIVAKQKMQEWLDALQSSNITPSHLLPLTLALPFSETAWPCYLHNGIYTVRTDRYAGFTATEQTLPSMLALVESNHNPQKLLHPITSLTELVVPDKKQTINLLQGDFSIKRRFFQKSAWKLVLYAVIIWMSIVFFGYIISSTLDSQKNNFLSLLATSSHRLKKLEYHDGALKLTLLYSNTPILMNDRKVARFKPIKTHKVHFTFQKISFDDFIKWLIMLRQRDKLTVYQLTATGNGIDGKVDVNVILQA